MVSKYYLHYRHLKPVQIVGALKQKLRKPKPVSGPALSIRKPTGHWERPAPKARTLIGPVRIRLANTESDIKTPGIWNDPNKDKDWLYNLHYFNDLMSKNGDKRTNWHWALIRRWVSENPPVKGVGWDPYPTSVRLVNWIKWLMAGRSPVPEMFASITLQARHVRRNMERHRLGHPLFSFAKALIFAGLFLDGPESEDWLNTGFNILKKELGEQILPDGGHFELSTLYHCTVLEDLLDMINICRAYPDAMPSAYFDMPARLESAAEKMISWQNIMTHPDGEISFFNDAALGVSPRPVELNEYAARLGLPVSHPGEGLTALEPSGYLRLQIGPAVLIFDASRPCPGHLPRHAHADSLSFEMSLNGRCFLVNSGTSSLFKPEERAVQRGTAAHNTVEINGRNSSQVWGAERMGRRAQPFALLFCEGDESLIVACSHNGYRGLLNSPVHRRQITLSPDRLVVEDRIDGGFKTAAAYFHFSPKVKAQGPRSGFTQAKLDFEGTLVQWTGQGCTGEFRATKYHPELGLAVANTTLAALLEKDAAVSVFSWE